MKKIVLLALSFFALAFFSLIAPTSMAEQSLRLSYSDINEDVFLAARVFQSTPESERKDLLGRWRNVDLVEFGLGDVSEKNPDKEFKIGVPYVMREVGGNSLTEALSNSISFLAYPAETASQRTVFAYEVSQISAQDWESIRAEVGIRDNDTFSFMVKHGDSFVGAPVKWNVVSASAIDATLKEGHQPTSLFISNIVEETVNWSNYVIGAPSPESAKSAYDSMVAVLYTPLGGEISSFIAFSEVPQALTDVEPLELVTMQGVSGRVLGAKYPSWPGFDDLSPTD